jgi:segregation and condensation protein B
MSEITLVNLVEAVLYLENRPVNLTYLVKLTGKTADEIKRSVSDLNQKYRETNSSLTIIENATGDYHLTISQSLYDQLSQFYDARKKMRLSNQAIETLAIVAYRQPITRSEIERVRGVKVGHIMKMLVDYKLVKFVGKKDAVGKPLLYGTTDFFLRSFGLLSLKDLPPISEFERE